MTLLAQARVVVTSAFSLLLISMLGFSQNNDKALKTYQLLNDEGIYIEFFDSTETGENRYTENNLSYKTSKVFDYTYSYQTENKEAYLIEVESNVTPSNINNWNFIAVDKKNKNTITGIRLTVQYGLQGFDKMIKGYNQSIIEFKYLLDSIPHNYIEKTGLIDNEKNLWMHPPRAFLFRILELNPFPFVIFDTSKPWKWDLKISDNWGDRRWKTWTGLIKNNIEYKQCGNKVINTSFGKLNCLKVLAEAKSILGKTTLESYYHKDYGFLKLIYNNIDGSVITFELKSIL